MFMIDTPILNCCGCGGGFSAHDRGQSAEFQKRFREKRRKEAERQRRFDQEEAARKRQGTPPPWGGAGTKPRT